MVRGRISSPVFVRFSPGVTKDQYFMMGAGRSARSFSLILGQFHQQMGANGSTLREKKVPRREVLASCPPARSQMAARRGWRWGEGVTRCAALGNDSINDERCNISPHPGMP